MPYVLTAKDKESDRLERRTAEPLVHGHMLWPAFVGVAALNNKMCRQAEHALSSVGRESLSGPDPAGTSDG